jgi:hypothetical protein
MDIDSSSDDELVKIKPKAKAKKTSKAAIEDSEVEEIKNLKESSEDELGEL